MFTWDNQAASSEGERCYAVFNLREGLILEILPRQDEVEDGRPVSWQRFTFDEPEMAELLAKRLMEAADEMRKAEKSP